MSLVVAGYDNGRLIIVSDTKLTYPDHMAYSLKNHLNFSFIEYGILKLVIVNENICIAFAGEVDYAESAIKEINPDTSFQNIRHVLLNYHQKSDKKTDFILATNFNVPNIHVIKDGKIESVTHAWIGDKLAFERFQKSRIDENKSIFSAIDDVINDDKIITVGGFKISANIDNGKFTFGFYMNLSREPMAFTLTAGNPIFIGHGMAEKGGYTLTFIGSSANYQHAAFHIKQGNVGVIYSRKDNGLFRPEIRSNMDEVDFHDYIISQLGISPVVSTQDRFQKFFSDAKTVYQKRDFINASLLFDKAFNEGKSAEKYEALFYKGVCFHFLKNPEAANIFRELVLVNSSYQSRILSLFNS